MLSREIATQMRGRALSWEIFPFSFREFLDYQGIDAGGPLSTRRRLLVRKAFDDYWERGGFPEVAGLDRALRIRVHQEYWGAMLFRDLVERHDVSHPRAVSDLAQRLVDNTASLYSVNRLTGYLQSLGHRAPKAAVSDYVEWFEDAFFLFTVRIFDASLARANANPKKIYCVDHALVRSVGSGVLVNAGHLLENLVFTALRRRTPDIRYFRDRSGRRGGLRGADAGRGARADSDLRIARGPEDAQAGSRGAQSGDVRAGVAGGHDRDPRRGGDGPGRCRPHRRRSCVALPPRPRVIPLVGGSQRRRDLTCTKRRAAAGAFTAATTRFSLGACWFRPARPTLGLENSDTMSEFSNKISP